MTCERQCGWGEWNVGAKRGLFTDQHHGPAERDQLTRLHICLVSFTFDRRRHTLTRLYIPSGGGFDSGSASDPKVDGSFLAAKVRRPSCSISIIPFDNLCQGIVFANFGYRLSLFAYPHSAELAESGETQNFGLLDTRAAVEWLRDNVRAFGGDPSKITLGGETISSDL